MLGLDRRTFPFAVGALAVWLFWALVVPWIDDAVPWSDQVRPGDVFRVPDTVTMTPAAGWGVRSGLRTTDTTDSGTTSGNVVLVADGVGFQITSGPWTGPPAQLLDRSTVIISTVVATDGFRVTDAAGTPEQLAARAPEIGEMSASTERFPVDDEEHARRRAAIEVSGRGAPFRLVQPHNAAFRVLLVLVAVGVLLMASPRWWCARSTTA